MNLLNTIMPVLVALKEAGGQPLVVGGYVRDQVLGLESKDVDIEVYGLPMAKMIAVIEACDMGGVKLVGKSFGVVKLRLDSGLEFDFSLPRKDIKVGDGHKGFEVEFDPNMGKAGACARRDFTMNAMQLDPFTGEVFDPFNGKQDLQDRVLRHASLHFVEDPLRVLRAFQFAGRFDMFLAWTTADRCHQMFDLDMWKSLPVERVWNEWQAWALKSTVHSSGLQTLYDSGWLEMFPELSALVGLEQDVRHHPEGDAWIHTLLTVDEAAKIAARDGLEGDDKLVLILAAVCHDLGKPSTTETQEDGRITTYGHDKAGAEPTRSFLTRIGAPPSIIERVVPLVCEHMVFRFRGQFTNRAFRKLAVRLAPETVQMLARVMEADGYARPPKPRENPFPELVARAEELEVLDAAPRPLLMGRHLLELGLEPGPRMGELIGLSFEAQLEGEFNNVDSAIAWVVSYIKEGSIKNQTKEKPDEVTDNDI